MQSRQQKCPRASGRGAGSWELTPGEGPSLTSAIASCGQQLKGTVVTETAGTCPKMLFRENILLKNVEKGLFLCMF